MTIILIVGLAMAAGSEIAWTHALLTPASEAPCFARDSPDGAMAPQIPMTLDDPGNENWAAAFHAPGTNDIVEALAAYGDGNLYARGDFGTAGEVSASPIARWDESSWSVLSSGMGDSVQPDKPIIRRGKRC